MKKLFALPGFIFLLSVACAQRVDLDRFNFSVSYRDFPESPLPGNYKTYNVRLEASPSLGLGYSSQNLENNIMLEGLKKVQSTGHITVLMIMDDLVFERPETIERVETSKDKQGKEIKKSFFSTQLSYSFAARLSVYDYKGNTLISNKILFDRANRGTYKTPESNSPEDATNYYTNKFNDARSSIAGQLTSTVVAQTNQLLNEQYGFPVRRVNDILWILNNRRHKAYSDQQKAWNDFKNAIVLMDANESLGKVKQKMQPVIDYFEKAKNEYNTSDKEGRKMRYASYYNLAKIYLYLDEPEKALMEADALAMNDFDERDGKMLHEVAALLIDKLRKNNADTRHFAVNVDDYASPVE